MHIYISTACQHDLHTRCRRVCKYCNEACLCLCHTRPKEIAVTNPESLDNPATPDSDLDPASPQDPGAYVQEFPVDAGDQQPQEPTSPEQGEPVVEPIEVDPADSNLDDSAEVGGDDDGELGDPADLPEAPEGDDDPDAGAEEDPDGDPGVALPDDPHNPDAG